jgi:hypothetical protein
MIIVCLLGYHDHALLWPLDVCSSSNEKRITASRQLEDTVEVVDVKSATV